MQTVTTLGLDIANAFFKSTASMRKAMLGYDISNAQGSAMLTGSNCSVMLAKGRQRT